MSRLPVVEAERYSELLHAKAEALASCFTPFDPPEMEIFPSPPMHYRMRAEFRIWHEGDDLYYVMFDTDEEALAAQQAAQAQDEAVSAQAEGVQARKPQGKKKKQRRQNRAPVKTVRMDDYPVASERINALMPALLAAIRDVPPLRHKLFQVEFLTTLTGEALVSLIYHRPLDEQWETLARQLQVDLGVSIIGRSRKQRLVLDREFVFERLTVDGQTLTYKQVENSFTQPNACICESMLSWAREATQGIGGDLVELYCGAGNFTVALAPNFRRVLGTEISRTSVAAGRFNIEINRAHNARVERLSAEEFSQALANPQSPYGQRLGLADYAFSTVLVDPPRAGLDPDTLKQVAEYDHIVYISCNPQTLVDNLTTLTQTHRLERLAFFDQFPYTDHAEAGVLLVRRDDV